MTGTGGDWRVLDGVATAWFEASSLTAGAALADRVLHEAPGAAVDVRAGGVRVRLADRHRGDAVSRAAAELGLTADPGPLQSLSVVIESPDPDALQGFWRQTLAYDVERGGRLVDPLMREPAVELRTSVEARPLRNRVHLDVVRPEGTIDRAGLGDASGPYGVRHADADGNEVDLVPGDPLGEGSAVADWSRVWGAMAAYRVASTSQQRELASAAAALADASGFPLLVDLRPGLVLLDTGKDLVEPDAHGLDLDVTDLAARLQVAARGVGAVADPSLPRLVQVFLDAADVPAVRAFWVAALGYVHDRREHLTDIHDPRRLGPVLALQQIDATEVERRRQRNRVHLELAVPSDLAPARVATAVAAGGRVLERAAGRWRIADPEGNELVVVDHG